MKTAISIPDTLFEYAEKVAKEMGVSRSTLYQKAIESFLKREQENAIVRKLNEVYSRVESAPPQDILRYQRDTISRVEW